MRYQSEIFWRHSRYVCTIVPDKSELVGPGVLIFGISSFLVVNFETSGLVLASDQMSKECLQKNQKDILSRTRDIPKFVKFQ